MKDSCNGFNMRVSMNSEYRFKIRSVTPDVRSREFFYASRLEPVVQGNETFQYFHRISGSTPQTKHIAVDVDIQNKAWRLLRLNGTDNQNEWLGYGSRHTNVTRLPKFFTLSAHIVQKGTMSLHKHQKHMHIPELNMSASNMKDFLHSVNQEPFLRIYDTRGLNDDQVTSLLDKKWSSKSDPRVIMRTAAFGHGRKTLGYSRRSLYMCVREHEGYSSDRFAEHAAPRHVVGIDDRNLVPLAIVWALRADKGDRFEI
ncbi:uncharacterized protein LY89DRAFT_457921 [Mollisia scopiformis]|uniref:Uncharacterized protein n=1 Tax=Mollisia scopiformis TaxID=149040 RepID=A0A194XHS8_MOLSC|nr:uncharacterized protein LY89DRAFT_457921 [Mollisia scopiformis]KUJ19684.1 hypothetical protein LY89DRAFT_457921 [Mollisia scopiformis]